MNVEKILSDRLVGKTLTGLEFNDYSDIEYYECIGIEPAVLPSKIISVKVGKDGDGDFLLRIKLENGTQATAYDNEDIYLEEDE